MSEPALKVHDRGPHLPKFPRGKLLLCGDLAGFGIGDLFSMLQMVQKTAVLWIRSSDGSRKIYFRKGEIVFASSDRPEDRLGQVLYRTGKLTLDQLRSAERQIRSGVRFGSLLLEQGLIQAKDLYWGVKYQIEEIVYGVFGLTRGEFFLIEDDPLEEDLLRLSFNTQNLLMEGFRRLDEWKLIQERLPDHSVVLTVRSDPPALELEPSHQKILSVIDGKSDLQEVIRRAGMGDFNTSRAVFELVRAGVLEVQGKGKGPSEAREEGVDTLRKMAEKYNRLYALILRQLREKAPAFDAAAAFAGFFGDLTDKLQKLFLGIGFDGEGRIDGELLLKNLGQMKLVGSGGFGRISGLSEIFVSQLLLDGLNELLSFELFTARNALPPEVAEALTKEVRRLQQAN